MRVILFQERFAGKVLYGSKCQTVRKSARCLPGDVLSLRVWKGKPYRSKQTVLFQTVCTEVVPVLIGDRYVCFNDGRPASPQEADAFAHKDGFMCWVDMRDWFEVNHGLPFHGFVIRWRCPLAPFKRRLERGMA